MWGPGGLPVEGSGGDLLVLVCWMGGERGTCRSDCFSHRLLTSLPPWSSCKPQAFGASWCPRLSEIPRVSHTPWLAALWLPLPQAYISAPLASLLFSFWNIVGTFSLSFWIRAIRNPLLRGLWINLSYSIRGLCNLDFSLIHSPFPAVLAPPHPTSKSELMWFR